MDQFRIVKMPDGFNALVAYRHGHIVIPELFDSYTDAITAALRLKSK